MNPHISAQLGEWPLGDTTLQPKILESDLWWNTNGWTANPIWMNGMDKSVDPYNYRFKNGTAREMQLSKERFGRGKWKFNLNISSIKGKDGEYYNIEFPEKNDFYTLEVF